MIQGDNEDFRLWRILDHTRFMIGRSREKEVARFGLTPEQARMLDILATNGGTVTINEIVNITQRQHNSISTLITRMCRQGLVKKIKDTRDYRRWDIIITEKGQKLFEQIPRDSVTEILSCLSPEAKKDLKSILQQAQIKAYEVLGMTYHPNILSD